MKKVITILLIMLVACGFVFADGTTYKDEFLADYNSTPNAYSAMGNKFIPTSPVMLGMGNSGLALSNNSLGIFVNPASLGEGKFKLSIPSVGFTLYHAYDMLVKDENGKNFIDKVTGENLDTSELITSVLDLVGSQFTQIAEVDSNFALTLPFGLGFGVYVNDGVYTYSGSVIDRANVSIALGFGHKLSFGDIDLSLGASAKVNGLAFNKRIKAADLTSGNMNEIEYSLACGYAFPFDIGATVKWKGLSGSLVVSNLNGDYKMDIASGKGFNSVPETKDLKYDVFTVTSRPNVSAGFGYEMDGNISLRAALDFVDLLDLGDSFKDQSVNNFRAILMHMNTGVEVGVFDTLMLRAGLQSGYVSFGASLDLYAFRLDCAYFWKEMGKAAGQKGLNGLSIRFNLGYDR